MKSFYLFMALLISFGAWLMVATSGEQVEAAIDKSILERIETLELEVEFLKRSIGVKTPDPAEPVKPEKSILKANKPVWNGNAWIDDGNRRRGNDHYYYSDWYRKLDKEHARDSKGNYIPCEKACIICSGAVN